ncbi:MAG: TIGR02680 family protein [Desulfocucumaceae bacterium]
MTNRWRMNRAGIVNFWHYDEAEFFLADGRLILRGANGSGKSVTMQSFLPLVLDGDKRPWRLDPFGSKDRRIDYYLLLEADSGHIDRTGYLYMEFYNPVQERYLTVGIGLRARRNNPNLSFWGFAITDNRRVGRDIQLYEKDYSQGKEIKIPLGRTQLEEVIGNGGQVVTEQGEYRRLVNKLLFGYEKIQSFQELLDLLIQLRSPKLSKDFKPSTIYEILTNALPSLQEEELRPLSEVLEDMDEINDRLNELSVHRMEAERLHQSYNRYNEFLLYSESLGLQQKKKQLDDQCRETDLCRAGAVALEEELGQKTESHRQAEYDLEQVGIEYKVLAASEAVEKRAELTRLREEKREIDNSSKRSNDRLQDWLQKKIRLIKEQADLVEQLDHSASRQSEILDDLENAARDIDFGYHDIYHRYWDSDIPFEGDFWTAWERDVRGHQQKIGKALKLAMEESGYKSERSRAEEYASKAREKRELVEQNLRGEEGNCERIHRDQEERIFNWRKGLIKLSPPEENMQQVLRALSAFNGEAYENVRAPIMRAHQEAVNSITGERLKWQSLLERREGERDRLVEEWRQWKNMREPEPPRSAAREISRARRGEGGAPLYALCEFRQGLSEEEKAALESVLQQSGLLDAWVTPGGMGLLGLDDEEIWLDPSPQILRPTLADYLVPTLPKSSNITVEMIDGLLRTVCMGTDAGESGEAVLTGQGYFRLGALRGKGVLKEKAEYIGKETRHRTRLAEMARLESLIDQEEKSMAECREQIDSLDSAAASLDEDLKAFPGGEPLQEAYHSYNMTKLRLEAALEEEKGKNGALREIIVKLQGATACLHDFMSDWNIPRTEKALEGARDQVNFYQERRGELKALWTEYRGARSSLERVERDLAEAGEKAGNEEAELGELRGRLRQLDNEIGIYERLLEELGITDIDRRLQELEDRQRALGGMIRVLKREISEISIKLGITQNNVVAAEGKLKQDEEELDWHIKDWFNEWNRRLVAAWAELAATPEDRPGVFRTAGQVVHRYRDRYASKTMADLSDQLFDVFYNTRQALHDYAPETVKEDGTGRLLVLFTRDRQNPVPPHLLAQEMRGLEEEQKNLLSQKDRELYEQIILHSVGKAIRDKIYRAEKWVQQMNKLMLQRETSSGLRLQLRWEPRAAAGENELDTAQLVRLLKTDPRQLRDDHIDQMIQHFRSRITRAKQEADQRDTLRTWIFRLLDYRYWFRFTLYYEKGTQPRREMTDARFNVLSGGEKALSMYIPLFVAVYSRYDDSRPDAPMIISLDEAFAGVDEENMRDMFGLLTQLGFDYMMTSQALWGCYDTVPKVSIYEIYRPGDVDFVTLIRYHWNGTRRILVDEEQKEIKDAVEQAG